MSCKCDQFQSCPECHTLLPDGWLVQEMAEPRRSLEELDAELTQVKAQRDQLLEVVAELLPWLSPVATISDYLDAEIDDERAARVVFPNDRGASSVGLHVLRNIRDTATKAREVRDAILSASENTNGK